MERLAPNGPAHGCSWCVYWISVTTDRRSSEREARRPRTTSETRGDARGAKRQAWSSTPTTHPQHVAASVTRFDARGGEPRAPSDVGMVRRAASASSVAYEELAPTGACLDVLKILGGLTTGSLIEGTMKAVIGRSVMRPPPSAPLGTAAKRRAWRLSRSRRGGQRRDLRQRSGAEHAGRRARPRRLFGDANRGAGWQRSVWRVHAVQLRSGTPDAVQRRGRLSRSVRFRLGHHGSPLPARRHVFDCHQGQSLWRTGLVLQRRHDVSVRSDCEQSGEPGGVVHHTAGARPVGRVEVQVAEHTELYAQHGRVDFVHVGSPARIRVVRERADHRSARRGEREQRRRKPIRNQPGRHTAAEDLSAACAWRRVHASLDWPRR
jgi:hypothetical protein